MDNIQKIQEQLHAGVLLNSSSKKLGKMTWENIRDGAFSGKIVGSYVFLRMLL